RSDRGAEAGAHAPRRAGRCRSRSAWPPGRRGGKPRRTTATWEFPFRGRRHHCTGLAAGAGRGRSVRHRPVRRPGELAAEAALVAASALAARKPHTGWRAVLGLLLGRELLARRSLRRLPGPVLLARAVSV